MRSFIDHCAERLNNDPKLKAVLNAIPVPNRLDLDD